ncbi:phosphoribosylpyrophosphate synthetase [Larkinella insperata]|uniref:Phosphoribosylpyrophosphate synthetase n=1 Tax=Larkinella insperata TaxID=332158 RepID=A0ABW3QCF9_9BACT|nr:phosphoribosylpyrophosphate synthetase [Larkinella insperata]
MQTYDTLVEALDDLNRKGFTLDFNLAGDSLICRSKDLQLSPEQFHIVDVYRFEGVSDPDDNSILYAIESKDGQKGTLVNAYGAYADELSDEMVEKLKID